MRKYYFASKTYHNCFFVTKWHFMIFIQTFWAFQRVAKPLKKKPGLSQGDQSSHREARPLKGRPGLSQGGRASNRFMQNLQKILIKVYILSNIQVSINNKSRHYGDETKIFVLGPISSSWTGCLFTFCIGA